MMRNHTETIRALAARPDCADAAVDALQGFVAAAPDATVLSDLAAAYYVRAQHRDQPVDLLRALETADRALKVDAHSPQALFNRALALEALSMTEDAVLAWDRVAQVEPGSWGRDASQHRNGLSQSLTRRASVQWPIHQERLPRAAASGDSKAVAGLIEGYPDAAQKYVEDVVLADWAETGSSVHLRLAEMIATEHARITGDRYISDVVQTISRSSAAPEQLVALRAAHRKFDEARRADLIRDVAPAAGLYRDARRLLARAGSPLQYSAAVGFAVNISYDKDQYRSAIDALDATEKAARADGYEQLRAWVSATRGHVVFYDDRYAESLERYTDALETYERTNNVAGTAIVHRARSGVYRVIGSTEQAWYEALQALRVADAIDEPQKRHTLRGEVAETALELGFPAIALLYQHVTVKIIEDALAAVPPGSDEAKRFRANLVIALRARAGIEVELGDLSAANTDLAESARLVAGKEEQGDAKIRRALLARIYEVQGQSAAGRDHAAAIAAFSRALEIGLADEYRTFRVRLLVQRANARRALGQTKAANSDLRLALDELRTEESRMLDSRKRGEAEEYLSIYFSRFDETYDRLIRQLMEEQRFREAFEYAERASAVEPLNLVMQLKVLPAGFPALTRTGKALDLATIQSALPVGTFLLQYRVLRDRTHAWLISRDSFQPLTLPVGHVTIEAWTAALQGAGRLYDRKAFETGLTAPYEALFRRPLDFMRQLPGGKDPATRLVVIPHGPMHGLPLAALRDVVGQHLVQKVVLSVDGSATLYVFSLMRNRALSATTAPSAMLFGNPQPRDPKMPRLTPAGKEVNRVRPFYEPHVQVFTGQAATMERLLQAGRENTIVHFGGHAISDAVPSQSRLILADGAITAVDLLQKARLDQTRLFVLAACSTAAGGPVGPEGLAPLVRPFIAAGVPAVVGSLWDVEDTTAEELLVRFHQHFRQGLDAAAALRRAQLDLLGDSRVGLNSPHVWSPYQVIGHAASPFAPTSNQQGVSSP